MSEKAENEEGVFSRWSRRKLRKVEDEAETLDQATELESSSEPALEVKALQKPVEQSELPTWQQDDVDIESKQKALAALFRQPEFKDVDHMNEYDEDFTQFDSLGDIVTAEMKRMLKIAEEKTRPKGLDDDVEYVNNTVELDSEEPSDDKQNDKEGDNLA